MTRKRTVYMSVAAVSQKTTELMAEVVSQRIRFSHSRSLTDRIVDAFRRFSHLSSSGVQEFPISAVCVLHSERWLILTTNIEITLLIHYLLNEFKRQRLVFVRKPQQLELVVFSQ